MKAVVCQQYGSPDVMQVEDVQKPLSGSKDILVKVSVASATAADCMVRQGIPI
ncbi:hypothetical protein RIF25_09585 [Thermosynechococcaceae cyanobacterium BACA0444]|uniref:Uncharacterized protein n=1 Tax=Pseudocalidococcus azoricus BACA0444 TaxID=2918990 RepID=A0AAE4JWH7_9CYAN|nr:hypothetical protein [Pseudocalidococcus azoricus]MDS3861056.1 hypothetical protein [Pseudocalidococcus azoricus BACA0444]